MSGDWNAVTRREHCPICDRTDWCGVATDGSAAICMRVESDRPTRNGGWLHRLRESTARSTRVVRVAIPTGAGGQDFEAISRKLRGNVSPRRLEDHALQLGVSTESLVRLGVGWDGEAWTFPMMNAHRRIIGIRRRFPDGRKLCVKGSRSGLFIPANLPNAGEVLICEGTTDAAALITIGFDAVGRASCRGSIGMLKAICKGRSVVIVADGDEPGRAGAEELARSLVLTCPSVKTIRPPMGVKDAREWVRRGAEHSTIRAAIDAASQLHLHIGSCDCGGTI